MSRQAITDDDDDDDDDDGKLNNSGFDKALDVLKPVSTQLMSDVQKEPSSSDTAIAEKSHRKRKTTSSKRKYQFSKLRNAKRI